MAAIAGDGPTVSVWRLNAIPTHERGGSDTPPGESACGQLTGGTPDPLQLAEGAPRLVAHYGRRPARASGWLRRGAHARWALAVSGTAGVLRLALAAPGCALQLLACPVRNPGADRDLRCLFVRVSGTRLIVCLLYTQP